MGKPDFKPEAASLLKISTQRWMTPRMSSTGMIGVAVGVAVVEGVVGTVAVAVIGAVAVAVIGAVAVVAEAVFVLSRAMSPTPRMCLPRPSPNLRPKTSPSLLPMTNPSLWQMTSLVLSLSKDIGWD